MTDMATGPRASGDADTDYKAKYDGLQRAFNKRHDEFTATSQALESERNRAAELEAELAALQGRPVPAAS